jgi:glycine/D-amino acid oxidase-like deaminating enzyme
MKIEEFTPEGGWAATLPAEPAARRLNGTERADCAIVGAGLTGLATARRLAELRPDWRILLLDSSRCGFGGSGRSSGFIVDLPDFAAEMPPEHRDRYRRVARIGFEDLRSLVRDHAIDCAWDDSGFLRGVAGKVGVRLLNRWPQWLDALGVAYEQLDAAAMQEITGTAFYCAGLHLPETALVQPAALVRGLRKALPANVEVYEDSPVRGFDGGREIRLTVGDGEVVARQVFLTTNGFTPALGFLQRRIFPILTFASLTRILEPEEQRRLGGKREWGILAVDPMGSTVRRTRDQRLLVRNTVRCSPATAIGERDRRRIGEQHRAAFRARFPNLADVPFAFTWAGVMGTSRNRQCFFGRMQQGLFAAAGFNGAGIAMGTAAGKLLADLALGVDSDRLRDLLALPPPAWIPPEPFLSLGSRFKVASMNAQAGAYI